MTREQAIMVLKMVDAYGVADEAKRMAIEALQTAEINCVHCPYYHEIEDDIGVHGHCKGDDG